MNKLTKNNEKEALRLNIYLEHLKKNFDEHKLNTIKQAGQSDIEPYDHSINTEKWYDQIYELIEKEQPISFVSSIQIFQDETDTVVGLSYIYSKDCVEVNNLSIDIFWI